MTALSFRTNPSKLFNPILSWKILSDEKKGKNYCPIKHLWKTEEFLKTSHNTNKRYPPVKKVKTRSHVTIKNISFGGTFFRRFSERENWSVGESERNRKSHSRFPFNLKLERISQKKGKRLHFQFSIESAMMNDGWVSVGWPSMLLDRITCRASNSKWWAV